MVATHNILSNPIEDDAWADARNCAADDLESAIALFASIVNDRAAHQVERELAGTRLRIFRAEHDRRQRVHRLATGKANYRDRASERWLAIRDEVKARVEVIDILPYLNIGVRQVGKDRRGRIEYASACPLCGGSDRLRSWSHPDSRAWCRQCQWSADVIAVASLIVGTGRSRDAVQWLVDQFLGGNSHA